MAPTDDSALAETLAAVARALSAEDDLTRLILRVCDLAAAAIEPAAHADIMVVAPGGTLTVPAATDWVGTRVVSLEEQTGEGPCIDAYRTGAIIDVPDLASDGRWSQFTAACLDDTPVRSGLGVPVVAGERPVGALDLYAERAHAFQEEDRAAAALFAVHAGVAFAAVRDRSNLERALANRDLIGQAKGILMAEQRCSADEAFDLLRSASQRLNRKLTAVARDVVDRTTSS